MRRIIDTVFDVSRSSWHIFSARRTSSGYVLHIFLLTLMCFVSLFLIFYLPIYASQSRSPRSTRQHCMFVCIVVVAAIFFWKLDTYGTQDEYRLHTQMHCRLLVKQWYKRQHCYYFSFEIIVCLETDLSTKNCTNDNTARMTNIVQTRTTKVSDWIQSYSIFPKSTKQFQSKTRNLSIAIVEIHLDPKSQWTNFRTLALIWELIESLFPIIVTCLPLILLYFQHLKLTVIYSN